MIENVDICMDLDKSGYEKHKANVAAILGRPVKNVTKKDIVKLKYQFSISYLGDIVRCLNAVGNICDDPAVVRRIECAQLREGRILIYEILKKLDRLLK